MSSYRQGDLVTLTGQIQHVEGDFLMIALEGALDAAVPAMVSKTRVSLVKASIHEGDIVEGGYRVHSFIPGTPLALIQLLQGDPTDPKTFSTALRDSLTLVRAAGSDDNADVAPAAPTPSAAIVAAPAPAPEAAPAPAPAPAPVEAQAAAPATETAQAPEASETTAGGEATATTEATDTQTDAAKPTGTLSAEMVRRPEAPASDRFSGIATDALRATEGRSIADLGTVREEKSPLKPATDELLLDQPVDDEKN